jgi:hypothetical protein
VSETTALRYRDLLPGPAANLHGKGGKERVCPLWPETIAAIKAQSSSTRPDPDQMVFLNARGHALSRHGVHHIIASHFHKERIGRKREALMAMRLQTESPPNPSDTLVGTAHFHRQSSRAPVRGIFRLALEREADEIGDSGIIDLTGGSGAGQVSQSGQTFATKAFPPVTHGVFTHLKLGSDFPIGFAFGTGEDHFRPSHLRHPSFARGGDFFQLAEFFVREVKFLFRSSSKHPSSKQPPCLL